MAKTSTNGVRVDTTIRRYVKYLVTIRCSQVKDYITPSAIDNILEWLLSSIKGMSVGDSVYETSGKYSQLHWHGIISVPQSFIYRPYTRWGDKEVTINTYNIHWKKITLLSGAIKYINKDLQHQTQEDILFWNYYSINRFDDTLPSKKGIKCVLD